jgi:small conductance mechanosensitive channel
MRLKLLLAVFLVFGVAWHPARAQSVAIHQAAPPASTTPTPAKAAASAIIPGSPLAALTGAAATPASPDDTAAPFGTDNLGLSFTSIIDNETSHTITSFVTAVRRSTALTPVVTWLAAFPSAPGPRAALARRAISQLPRHATASGLADAEAGETEKPPRKKLSIRAWLRRLALGLVYFLLSILPVAGFVLTAGVLLGTGLVTGRDARLAIIGLSNAYLFCRLILETFRFVLAPKIPALRLVTLSTRRANWLVRWVRALLFTGAAGYAVISLCELLGLDKPGTMVLTRLVVLAVHLEAATMVWQSRHVVAHWIAGDPKADTFFATFRRRLASVWYILALFYIIALWVAWAGGVHNAFGVLLRVVLVFLGALLAGRMAWTGSTHLLERLFPDTTDKTSRHANFYARARVYNPLIRAVIRVVIAVAVLVVILQGWGIGAWPWLLKNEICRSLISAFVAIVITVAVALLLWEISNALINAKIDQLAAAGRTRQASRLRTLLPMLKATIGVTISLVAGLICLSKIGVNAAPLLAGAGVVGIAVGFGSQKLVQDIITGLFLLLEDAMQVGDVISLASMTGTVERLSIRTIRLRGGDGSVNIIPFSAVTTVTNMTRDFGYAQISIQVSYEEDLPRVYAVLTDIGRTMREEPTWGAMMRDNLQIFGLDQFGASALVITGQIRTGPGQHWAVRREFNARVKARFAEEHIEMPYTYLPPAPAKPVELPPDERPTPGAEKEA